jgi:NAD(P)-dependent dehydrogenase (short-subunit alcohol dehydrogenase family)
LPPAQAFWIEYWQLEEAKLRRLPPEKEFSRKVMVVIGGGCSGIGREVALLGARRGAHVVVGDRDAKSAEAVASEIRDSSGAETSLSTSLDIATATRSVERCARRYRATAASTSSLTLLLFFPPLRAVVFPTSSGG